MTRRPLPCLLFVLPLLLVYELGLLWVGGTATDSLRAGADSWIRQAMATCGLTDRWLPPLVLIISLLTWQAIDHREWRFHPVILGGMLIESLFLAVVLMGLSQLVDFGFNHLEATPAEPLRFAAATRVEPLLGFVGAGIYEEALFRLTLIPICFRVLKCLAVPGLVACTLAMTGSSLLFSLAHHAGAPGEAFSLFAFVFRWLAGVFFAYVYVVRGFGIAVGTHSAYDLLVGWSEIHF